MSSVYFRNLYSLREQNMYVQQLDGRYRTVLYKDHLSLPRALVVHPRIGYVFQFLSLICINNMNYFSYAYLTDWSANAFIGKAAMDGSSFKKLITNAVVWPNGLAIDYY